MDSPLQSHLDVDLAVIRCSRPAKSRNRVPPSCLMMKQCKDIDAVCTPYLSSEVNSATKVPSFLNEHELSQCTLPIKNPVKTDQREMFQCRYQTLLVLSVLQFNSLLPCVVFTGKVNQVRKNDITNDEQCLRDKIINLITANTSLVHGNTL